MKKFLNFWSTFVVIVEDVLVVLIGLFMMGLMAIFIVWLLKS